MGTLTPNSALTSGSIRSILFALDSNPTTSLARDHLGQDMA
jgi:hypothetical protein